MRRFLFTAAFMLAAFALSAQTQEDAPFGWGAKTTGGDAAKTVVLQSNGLDMSSLIVKSLKDYDVVVFDGSKGEFMVAGTMRLSGLSGKTVMGVNGARIRTQFQVTPELQQLLDEKNVRSMSTHGGGGTLSNGAKVGEERELNTRQAIIDKFGDKTEKYRDAGIFSFSACDNIIIRNLALEGPGAIDVGGADLLTISNASRNFWVDHCSFTDGMDGNFDINSRSDNITVSWCVFQYTDRSYDHRATNLIGSSENPNQGVDNLNVTYAYNMWGEGCDVRMPAVRWGKIHLLNNYYNCAGNAHSAITAARGAEILVEGNYFEKGINMILDASEDAEAWQFKGNIFRDKYKPQDKGVVELPYEYQPVAASKVKKMVLAGAGPVLDLKAPESSVKFTIHMIGDSTMADKNISNLNPERGWGMVFENFVDDQVRVINYAKNGRSTKSFVDQGLWDEVKANMRPGDYLFVQFAHNDQKEGNEAVYAPAWGAYQDYLRMFINTAREIGATPVLFTSVARRHFYDNVLDEETLGEYPEAMKAVAKEMGVVCIDMEAATIDWIKKAGDLASREYFMWIEPGTNPSAPAGKQDNTHSTPRGARRNCEIASDSLKVRIPEIAEHLVHYDFVVDKDGRGDFLTVQEAIDAVPDYLTKRQKTILVKPGVYKERIIIPASKSNLKIIGCGAENTVITYDNAARKLWPDTNDEIGTFGSSSVFVDADNVTFQDISIRNDAGSGDLVGQAVAITTNGDGIFFHRCRIVANQDTIYTGGRRSGSGKACRSYYLDCYIEGTTDFIFGAGIALFEDCHIHSKRNSYVTAASTAQGEKYGYVFKSCRLTADLEINKVHLGRPWRDYAKVVYLECYLGDHIVPAGWHNWSRPEREKTAFYAEYKNYGPGADPDSRVSWSHQLTDEQAAEYSLEKIMGTGYESVWKPTE